MADQDNNERRRLPSLFDGVRVMWYISHLHYGRGTVTAVYSDGTIDVDSDVGPKFKGWSFDTVFREMD